MIRVLLVLFLAVPLFAQPDDIRLQFHVWSGPYEVEVTRVPVNVQVQYELRIDCNGPITRDNEVLLDIPGRVLWITTSSDRDELVTCTPLGTRPIRCTFAAPQPYELHGFISAGVVYDTGGSATAVGRHADTQVTNTIEVVDLPSLSAFASPGFIPGFRVRPGQALTYQSWVGGSGATATNVRIRHTLPEGGTFVAARPADAETQCSVTPQEVVCTRAALAHNVNAVIELDVLAPDRLTGGEVVLRVEVTKDEQDFDPSNDVYESATTLVRHLVVTNTNDEGSGSLRQALLDAQALCATVPCTVAFAIPGAPENGLFEIRPKSALPEVRGMVKIDGATQQGARIVLNGAEAGLVHGLLLGPGCELQVLDLNITGFLWPGIEAHRGNRYPEECPSIFSLEIHPPTLIARNRISSNYRGVVLVESGEVTVRDNVITSNHRSGIFVDRGFFAEVTGNTITGNGAAGLFLDVGTRGTQFPGGAVVTGNVISGNSEWGITRTGNGEVQIQRNSIFGNPHPAIDMNLDFETPNRPHDDLLSIPNKPVLLSAFYDPAREKTVVTLRLDVENGHPYEIDFYANDPAGLSPQWQTEEWVAMEQLPGSAIHREMTFELPRDLRGRLLVATTSRGRFTSFVTHSHTRYTAYDTSEVSNAVMVQ